MVDGKVYFWERTNSYVVRNSDNISYANLGHTTRKISGYVRFYDNTVNGNITIGAAEENDNWPLTVKDCNISGRAENIIDNGLYLRCTIKSATSSNSNNTWNNALDNGNFKNCTISNIKSSMNISSYIFKSTIFIDSARIFTSFITNSAILEITIT